MIRLWDARTGGELRAFENPLGRVIHAVALSPDGRRLVSGGLHAIVTLWDTDTGQEILEIPTRHTVVTGVQFSPEGTRLAAVCNDGTVVVWDGPSPAPGGNSLRP
jgi:WD40 repeat protein